MRKGRSLDLGGRVALVAPCGPLRRDRLPAVRRLLKAKGYEMRSFLPGKPLPYLAGKDKERRRLFLSAWKNPGAGFLLVARGGYGASRTLEGFSARDFAKGEPKLLCGFSDVTALLNFLADRAKVICLHGPNASGLLMANPATKNSFWRAVTGKTGKGSVLARGLKGGGPSVTGRLAGGNLTVLASLVGTPFEVPLAGKILFLEDVNEDLYRLDRSLTQLRQGGGLGNMRAVVLGSFHDGRNRKIPPAKIAALVADRLPRRVPIATGLAVGHYGTNLTLPVGAKVHLNSRNGTLVLLEDVVKN